jgi:anti-anti-sigma factor
MRGWPMTLEDSAHPGGFQPPPAFRVEALEAPKGVSLLLLAGEIDLATSGRFRAHVESAVQSRVRGLVVDLSEVTFMDSTMLRELLRAHHDIGGAGGRLVLADVRAPVSRLLELTGTDGVLTVVVDRAGALRLVTEGDSPAAQD